MPTWLAVAFGGAGGAVLRWLVASRFNAAFPLGTLLVNVLGSFAIGYLFVVLEGRGIGDPHRAGIIVGLLGGFTTFSAFSMETFNLLAQGAQGRALANILLNVGVCLLAAWAGVASARWLT